MTAPSLGTMARALAGAQATLDRAREDHALALELGGAGDPATVAVARAIALLEVHVARLADRLDRTLAAATPGAR